MKNYKIVDAGNGNFMEAYKTLNEAEIGLIKFNQSYKKDIEAKGYNTMYTGKFEIIECEPIFFQYDK